MPPKKNAQVYLVVQNDEDGNLHDIVAAYSTAALAEEAASTNEDDSYEVRAVELHETVKNTKTTKKTKTDPMDVDQPKAKTEKRKQTPGTDSTALDGINLIFTGTFSAGRKQIEAMAVANGATLVSSMKKATYIVVGTKPGPNKVTEIEENGYQTWSEDDLNEHITAGGGKKMKSS